MEIEKGGDRWLKIALNYKFRGRRAREYTEYERKHTFGSRSGGKILVVTENNHPVTYR
jgi:hypothetical protein